MNWTMMRGGNGRNWAVSALKRKMARTVGAWHEDEDAGKMPAFPG